MSGNRLCMNAHPIQPYYCTRSPQHEGEHAARALYLGYPGEGPEYREVARWTAA